MKLLYATQYNVYMEVGDLVTLSAVKSKKLGTVASLGWIDLPYKSKVGHIVVFWSSGEWQGKLKAHNTWDIELVR